MSCPQVIEVVTPGPPGPSGDASTITGPAVLGRGSGTGGAVPLPLGAGLSIVNGALVATAQSAYPSLSMPTGFAISGSGTASISVAFAAGYSLPTTAKQALWDNAVQPGSLAAVALSGAYGDLTGSPNLALKADLVGGVVPSSQIPAIAISDYLGSVSSQSAMLALSGQRGDWCLRTDGNNRGQWVLSGDDASQLGNWVQIITPVSPVQSVNGQTGAVTLGPGDVGAATAAQGAKADTAIQPGNAALSDARTPTAHAASHATGGSDAITPAAIGAATAAQGAKADTAVQPAALSSYVQTGDARLTDAREWSAETIGQAEAEAGTSTTRRAFTAQRVAQAIAAWWTATSTAAGRSLVTAADAAAQRTALGLGTAATTNASAYATAAQGSKADTAVQPGSLATVATSGSYSDLSNRPTLGTFAAANAATPPAIGGTTPAAGAFTDLSASASLLLPGAAPSVPAAGHVYRSTNTLRYRDSTGAERLILNAQDNLANLADAAVARSNLGAATSGPITSSGLTQSTARLLGRGTAGTGAVEEITLGTGLSLSGTTLNAAGGTPGGANGQVQFNNSGAFGGIPTLTADGSGNLTFTGQWINSRNGAANVPASSLTGTWFTGGTATTTKPHFLIEPAGTTSTNWNPSGTGLGVNAPSGFAGNLLDLQVNGSSRARVTNTGQLFLASATSGSLIINDSAGIELKYGSAGLYCVIDYAQIRGGSGGNFSITSSNNFGNNVCGLLAFHESGVWNGAIGDTRLQRDGAANTLAQRNGTNAQAFRLYNTFTSATNFERLNVRWTANEAIIDTEAGGGGGTLRGLKVGGASTSLLGFYGATPAVQPTAVANATDATTVITQLNALLSRLRTIGIIAT